MPSPEVYDAEIKSWPWKNVVSHIAKRIVGDLPRNGIVLDYMCGTGELFRQIRKFRSDARLVGCDVSQEYIRYARSQLPSAEWIADDALEFSPDFAPNFIVCSAGLHHLREVSQKVFLRRVESQLMPGGIFLLGEEVLPFHESKPDRLEAIRTLYVEIFDWLARRRLNRAVMEASLNVLFNDILLRGEFKLSAQQLETMLTKRFTIVSQSWIWPSPSPGFGDVVYTCRPK